MKTTSIYLSEITQIDHSFIDENGFVIGDSYNLSISVSGNITENERVICDFSQIKKLAKQAIDNEENGFDHKLWVLPYSKCEVIHNEVITVIKTPKVELTIPNSAVHVFKKYNSNKEANIIKNIESYLNEYFKNEYTFRCFLDRQVLTQFGQYYPFRYTHGLKNSSSRGCQNIAHGHYSFITIGVETTSKHPDFTRFLLDDMFDNYSAEEINYHAALTAVIDFFNNVIFINPDNIKETNSKYILLNYITSRGEFIMKIFNGRNKQNVFITPEETTCELLIDVIIDKLKSQFQLLNIKPKKGLALFLSEGLRKGSYKLI